MLRDSYNPFRCFRGMIFRTLHCVVRMTRARVTVEVALQQTTDHAAWRRPPLFLINVLDSSAMLRSTIKDTGARGNVCPEALHQPRLCSAPPAFARHNGRRGQQDLGKV